MEEEEKILKIVNEIYTDGNSLEDRLKKRQTSNLSNVLIYLVENNSFYSEDYFNLIKENLFFYINKSISLEKRELNLQNFIIYLFNDKNIFKKILNLTLVINKIKNPENKDLDLKLFFMFLLKKNYNKTKQYLNDFLQSSGFNYNVNYLSYEGFIQNIINYNKDINFKTDYKDKKEKENFINELCNKILNLKISLESGKGKKNKKKKKINKDKDKEKNKNNNKDIIEKEEEIPKTKVNEINNKDNENNNKDNESKNKDNENNSKNINKDNENKNKDNEKIIKNNENIIKDNVNNNKDNENNIKDSNNNFIIKENLFNDDKKIFEEINSLDDENENNINKSIDNDNDNSTTNLNTLTYKMTVLDYFKERKQFYNEKGIETTILDTIINSFQEQLSIKNFHVSNDMSDIHYEVLIQLIRTMKKDKDYPNTELNGYFCYKKNNKYIESFYSIIPLNIIYDKINKTEHYQSDDFLNPSNEIEKQALKSRAISLEYYINSNFLSKKNKIPQGPRIIFPLI